MDGAITFSIVTRLHVFLLLIHLHSGRWTTSTLTRIDCIAFGDDPKHWHHDLYFLLDETPFSFPLSSLCLHPNLGAYHDWFSFCAFGSLGTFIPSRSSSQVFSSPYIFDDGLICVSPVVVTYLHSRPFDEENTFTKVTMVMIEA